MLFRGVGGLWWPHSPLIDGILSERLSKRGYSGSRVAGSVFGSTSREHALEYAKARDDKYLRILEPQVGSVVSWAPGVRDMMIAFERHLNALRINCTNIVKHVNVGELLADVAGDCAVADNYLAQGRMKKEISAIADLFLDDLLIVECRFSRSETLEGLLAGHTGEVWIAGPCVIKHYDAVLHSEFDWVQTPSPIF